MQRVFACLHGIVDAEMKRVVAKCPASHFLAVDLDVRIAHGSVKHQRHTLALYLGHIERGAIFTFADIGQTAGTTGFHRFLGLTILFHSHHLQVVAAVERTIDGPIVRNTHILPLGAGIRCALGKLPPLGNHAFAASASQHCRNKTRRKQNRKYLMHK